jgi:SAM-dependent methyltransferase
MKNNNTYDNIDSGFYIFGGKEIYAQSLIHLINLYLPKNSTVVELGTGYGQTACMIAQLCPTVKTIYTVDPYLPYRTFFKDNGFFGKKEVENAKMIAKHNIEFSGFQEKIKLIDSDCLSSISMFEDESIDLLFYDATQSSNSALSDLSSWYGKVKPGGIISGHCWELLKNGIEKFKYNIKNENHLSIHDDVWAFIK